MGLSDVRDFFDSKAHEGWMKSREGEQKLQMAVIERLDTLIKAIGNLGR